MITDWMLMDRFWDWMLMDRFWQGVIVTLLVLVVFQLIYNGVFMIVRRVVRGRRLPAEGWKHACCRFMADLLGPPRWRVPTVKYPDPHQQLVSQPELFLERSEAAAPASAPIEQERSAEDASGAVVVPRFGAPVRTTYVPSIYEEPLRCSSGVECGSRLLEPGEEFYMIPPPGNPVGPFVVLCIDDVVTQQAVARG